MHKCIVCGNASQNTKYTRPELIYHTFPKNEYRRRKWLKVFGFTQCHDWHRICSDHFLEKDYKLGEKRLLWPHTIPQPFDQNYNDDNFSNNTLNDDGQISNNECLPMNQNLVIDDQIEEIVVNNFESPRRSSRKIKLTTTNEDMSYENMPRLQTERYEKRVPTYIPNDSPNDTANENNQSVQVPAYQDHSSGSGIRCSVKNCRNRYSKNLSFFGYPKNFNMRKLWFEKCGIEGVDPTKKLKSTLKVCGQHFKDDCFMNSKKQNRLRYDAVPTLFLDNDTSLIDERNIPSTSSSSNNGFIFMDKSPFLSSNYSENEETNQPPIEYVTYEVGCSTTNTSKLVCCVPGCMTNSDVNTKKSKNPDVQFFNPNLGSLDNWSSILGIKLVKNSTICANHFRPQDIIPTQMDVNDIKGVVRALVDDAMPLPVHFNSIQSATTTKQLEINALPLKTYEGRKKRSRANNNKKHLSTKKIRNSLINKSNTTTETMYISGNEDNVYASATNGTHNYVSTCDLNPTLESNTVNTNNLSKNIDNVSTSNTFKPSFIEVLPKILANSSLSFHLQSNDEHYTNKQISAIDNNKEVVKSYAKQPILKKILTENMSNVYYMYPTTSDNSSIINSSSEKTCPINVSDTSLTNSEKPVKPVVDFSMVKMEPNDDISDSLETNFEQITETHNSMHNNLQSSLIQYEENWDTTPKQSTVNSEFSAFPTTELKIKPELIENNDDLPLSPTSIDDSLSIEMSNLNQKLKKITANSSLSITLEPFESNRAIEPSVNLFSKTSAKSSMSITLQPKIKHNPSVTTNNSYPSVSLIPSTPSTSSAMYNISQHNSTQYEQKSVSTLNIPNQLSSNNLIYPKFINNQMIKAISPIYKPNLLELSESHEIRNPVIDTYYSLKSMPNDFNSNYSTNISEFTIDENNSEDDTRVEEKDNGFIYEVSKTVTLPVSWTSIHNNKQNSTVFCQLNDFKETVKKVNFSNSLVPTILMYGKKYQHNIPIKTKIQLETLLKKIDNFQQCSGNDGYNHDECIGYFEPHLTDIDLCSVCQNIIKDQDMHKITTIIAYKSKTIASLENKISERKLRVNEARKMLQKIKKKENNRVLYTIDPSGISNVMNHYEH
ncbi:putative uncharacterized protein DDB_G0291812 [Rhopalosiphum maidis]|uniref:putative uncharacterized protein DDB_G0291812 n=1 Tax=Rhopalosiphum maidis TaxID=43146 RepID=UPI000EFEC9C8|nr:putative uncharacterized protein DDB_G0291812 [Rhopalosiphum maidis]